MVYDALADFSPIGIILFILYTLYSISQAKKKKQKKQRKPQRPQTSASDIPNQPGKSIEDILRELEQRAQGKGKPVEIETPPEPIPEIFSEPQEKTVADFKKEKHSDMKAHHVTLDELNDGKFDQIDDRLMHLENLELDAHKPKEGARYTAEDLKQAVIWDAILNRPYD